MRIADNVSAIKRALDKITGAARSGTRFSALEPGEQPKNMGSSHDFNLMTGGCNICQCSWEEIQDGLVSRDTCDGPVDVPRRFWVSKHGITEYWIRPDGARFHRILELPQRGLSIVPVTPHAEFKAWLNGAEYILVTEYPAIGLVPHNESYWETARNLGLPNQPVRDWKYVAPSQPPLPPLMPPSERW